VGGPTLALTHWQRRRLERQLATTRDAAIYRRTLAILEVARGTPVTQVAERLRVVRRTVYNWIETYREAGDPVGLADSPRSGRPRLWTEDLRGLLRSLLADHAPDELGYPAVNWTVPLLREHLRRGTGRALSGDTIRRELQRSGYVWKRSRYVLDPDPEEEKKTADSPQAAAAAGPGRHLGRG
jgi:transposase